MEQRPKKLRDLVRDVALCETLCQERTQVSYVPSNLVLRFGVNKRSHHPPLAV